MIKKIKISTKMQIIIAVFLGIAMILSAIGSKDIKLLLVWIVIQSILYLFWYRLSWRTISKTNFIFEWDGDVNTNLETLSPRNNSESRMHRLLRTIQFRQITLTQMQRDIVHLSDELTRYSNNIQQVSESIDHLKYQVAINTNINKYVVDQADHFLVEIDGNGTILKLNAMFETRLGYHLSDFIGKSFELMIQKQDSSESSGIEELISAMEEPVFINLLYKNHQNKASEYVSFKTLYLKENRFLCVGKSISDEIAIQSRIIRKKKELDYINQINSALISNRSVEELLENILKKLEGLFNMSFGCVYTLEDSNQWHLKTFLSKSLDKEEFLSIRFETLFDEAWLNAPKVKIITLSKANPILIDYAKYLALAPLEVEGKVIAIMCAGLVSKVNLNDYNVLKMFNNQASIVVQRAMIYEKLRLQYFSTIEALVSVIEAKDKYTEGHSRRVSRFAVEIAKKMGYSNEEIENVEISGLLHDVGKIGIDQAILTKRGRLTVEEYQEMKLHPEKGIQVLHSIQLREEIREGILYHHLRYDLKGYPVSDKEELPEFAAIIGAADAFDAITSARSYSKETSIEEALEELIRHKGTQFSPEIVDIMEALALNKRSVLQKIIDDESQGDNYVISGTLQTVASTGF